MNLTIERSTLIAYSGLVKHIVKRGTSKIAVEVEPDILNKLENEQLKPRKHPGVIKLSRIELPINIAKALQKAVGDYPVKALLEDAKKLNRFLSKRHPPPEPDEINTKMSRIIEDINAVMPIEKTSQLNEVEKRKWQQRRDNLVRKRFSERIYAWKPIVYGPYEAIVYALGRGAKEFAALKRILQEIVNRDPDFKPNSYLDFGSGVGTGMWAVSTLWENTIYEYFNVDSSREMNDLSELILRNGNENHEIPLRNVFYRQFLPALETKYDLVVCSYSLFELPSTKHRQDVLLNLWAKCDGYLIVVEEGTRRGSQLVNAARDLILSLDNPKAAGHVFAPCPHDKICPRFSNLNDRTPCNFETLYEEPQHCKISQAYGVACYSYIILKKGLPQEANSWPRIVRPTLVRSRHAICRMCTSEGKLQEVIFTKSKHGRFAYRCAKASRWGDRLPIIIGEPFCTKEISPYSTESKENTLSNSLDNRSTSI
uniref:Methyltransferase-like protein 17, mitochondrial n=1 Tax=Glossina palpalis gambiensis TaxID=67801 RepID=A0A1B0C547_9MUSC